MERCNVTTPEIIMFDVIEDSDHCLFGFCPLHKNDGNDGNDVYIGMVCT